MYHREFEGVSLITVVEPSQHTSFTFTKYPYRLNLLSVLFSPLHWRQTPPHTLYLLVAVVGERRIQVWHSGAVVC